MRTLPAVFAMVAITIVATAQQKELPVPKSLIKISPQHFANNSFKMGVEAFNSEHAKSVCGFVTAMLRNGGFNPEGGHRGVAAELQYRKYISPIKQLVTKRNKAYHQGIYSGLFLQGGMYSGEFSGVDFTFERGTNNFIQTPYAYEEAVKNMAFGAMLGYHRTLWEVVYIDIFIGGGLQLSDIKLTGEAPEWAYDTFRDFTEPQYQGVLPKFGVLLGVKL